MCGSRDNVSMDKAAGELYCTEIKSPQKGMGRAWTSAVRTHQICADMLSAAARSSHHQGAHDRHHQAGTVGDVEVDRVATRHLSVDAASRSDGRDRDWGSSRHLVLIQGEATEPDDVVQDAVRGVLCCRPTIAQISQRGCRGAEIVGLTLGDGHGGGAHEGQGWTQEKTRRG